MLEIRFYCIFFIGILGCTNSKTSKEISLKVKTDSTISSNFSRNGLSDTSGFFSNCQELINHSALGSLQGVESSSDSIKNIYFADCFDYCKETFQIIFLHKDVNKRNDRNYDFLTKEFHDGCDDYFKNFECFAFVCSMRDPDKQKDIHALNIDFPIEIKIYERILDDNWKFIKKDTVKTFEEYGYIRFKTIYHLN